MHCLVAVTIVALGGTASRAADIFVDDDTCPGAGSGTQADPYCSIQTAIGVAINNDDIIVAPGTYRELINFLGKNITLRSSDGPEVTIINGDIDNDGVGDGTVVSCVNNETVLTVLDGFTITGGQATSGHGGGMINSPGNPTVTNCIFRLNTAASLGGGMVNFGSNPTVTNCSFELNMAASGGGMNNDSSSPTVTNCTFSNNAASADGGGMSNRFSANPTVTNCKFSDNAAGDRAGGIFNVHSNPTVTNCIFTRNTAVTLGGGMFNSDSSLTVANCTFLQNAANGNGGAISGGGGTFANCIIWDNSSAQVDEIDGTPTVTYSDVLGVGVFPGIGNINMNPLFVDPVNGDFHISAGSPCIDAADNTAVPADSTDLDGDFDFAEPIPLDLDGNPRFVDDPATADTGNPGPPGPLVDMGAYEFRPCPTDVNGDGVTNVLDLIQLLQCFGLPATPPCATGQDVNADGTVNVLDLIIVLLAFGQACPTG